MNELMLAIYESERNGKISIDQRNSMLEIIEEGVFSNPLRKFREKIKDIKKTKPSEYDGPGEIKKYIDDNYDNLIKASELIEKEPEDLRKNEIKIMITVILGWLSYAATIIISPLGTGLVVGAVIAITAFVASIIQSLITYARTKNDISVINNLTKIKSALIKIRDKDIPDEYKKRISKIITSIGDAETEISDKIKVSKESTNLVDPLFDEWFD